MSERPDGLYWVRVLSRDSKWEPARFEHGEWFLIGVLVGLAKVAEVGPAIPPPFGLERSSAGAGDT